MSKIKVMKMVEVEIDGDEVIAHLRDKAELSKFCPFIVGDIIDPNTPHNKDVFDDFDEVPSVAIITKIDTNDGGGELLIGFLDKDGDYVEDIWIDCEDVRLLVAAPRPAEQIAQTSSESAEKSAPSGFGSYKDVW